MANMRFCCVGVLALLLAGEALTFALAEETFVFGISLALHPPPGQSFADVQTDALSGLIVWKDWWNAKPASERMMTRNGVPFKVELHIETFSNFTDSESNRILLFDVYRQMALNTSIDFLFMPVATPWDIPLRTYTYNDLNVPYMVAIADSSAAYYSTPGSYGSVTANNLALTSYLPYLRVAKAKSVAVIKVNEVYQLELCEGVTSQASLNSLDIQHDAVMDFDYNTFGAVTTPERIAAWNQALDRAIELNVDALFICDYGVGSEYAVSYLKKKNWAPKSLTLSTLFVPWADPSNLNFITTVTSFDRTAKFPAQEGIGTCADYSNLLQTRYGTTATAITARATLAGMIFSHAIQSANGNSTAAMIQALSTGQVNSFMGTSAFDTLNRQTLASLDIQLMNNQTKSNVIGPALAAAEQLIYPMPSWEERIFNPKWGHGTEIAGVVLMSVGGLVTVGWLVFLFIHWNHKVIVAASPLFLLAILVGCLIVIISIFNWMPNLINDSICSLRAWLLPLGFMTMFGALLAKTHRIHRLYNSKGINVIVIRNLQVAFITLAIVVGQAILSILMITVTNLSSRVHVVDEHRVSLNYRVCASSTALRALLGVNVGYAFILLIWGTYLAYRIRKVPISIYDESKVIAFSIYNTCFFGIIVIVIQLAIGNSNRHLTFMITAVCCFLGAMITTSCLFAAKLWAIYRPSSTYRSSNPTFTSSSGDSRTKSASYSNVSVIREETAAAPASESRSKKKVKQYKQHIRDLKERVRQLEALAKSNGFLTDDQATELAETPIQKKGESQPIKRHDYSRKSANSSSQGTTPATTAISNDKNSAKAPKNRAPDSSEEDSS